MIPSELPKHTVVPQNTRSGAAENKQIEKFLLGKTKKSPYWFIYSRRRLTLDRNSVSPEEIYKSIVTLNLLHLASTGAFNVALWCSFSLQ
jgi:hypothetical protein